MKPMLIYSFPAPELQACGGKSSLGCVLIGVCP